MLDSPGGNSAESGGDYSSYERILTEENLQYDHLPNQYLQYFKEEFKLWKDFFK